MELNSSEEAILQNLKDAGCSLEVAQSIMSDLREGKESSGLKQLMAHRRTLLDNIHKEQKCIDCLDYLVYCMKKSQ